MHADDRDTILERVRIARRDAETSTRTTHPDPPAIAAPPADRTVEPPPATAAIRLVDDFARNLEANGGICHRATTSGRGRAIANVARSVRREGLARLDPLVVELLGGVPDPTLLAPSAPRRGSPRRARNHPGTRGGRIRDDPDGGGRGRGGRFADGAESPRRTASGHHLAILVASDRSDLGRGLEQVADRPSPASHRHRPQRTADIELELVVGVRVRPTAWAPGLDGQDPPAGPRSSASIAVLGSMGKSSRHRSSIEIARSRFGEGQRARAGPWD